ncbi:MAG: NAD-dependent epimerase/dehydratase family protein [Dehalococcoidia bacterium]
MILVTGATGFLGSALVDYLVREGVPVRALVRSPQKAGVLPVSVERVPGDLSDEVSLRRAMEGCEGVMHLAAQVAASVGAGSSFDATRESIVGGTKRVMEAATRAGVRRMVYASSSAGIVDATGLVSEQAPNRTALTAAYSVSKAEMEGLIFKAVADGFDVRIVNIVNGYGPCPAGVLSYTTALLQAARGEVDAIIDAEVGWVYTEDVSRGHLLAYERGEPGKRYVLCGETMRFPEILNRAAKLWDSAHRVRPLPIGTPVDPNASFFYHRAASYGALGPVRIDDAQARGIGFQPRGVEEGLRLTMEWLRASEDIGGGR